MTAQASSDSPLEALRPLVGEWLHTTAATDVAALPDTLEVELASAGFAPARRAILTAAAPRWDDGGGQ